MKRLLLASTALVFGGQASAADLPAMPVKAPIAAPAPFSWTSCYIGGHVGAGWGRKDFSDPGFTTPFGTFQNFAPPGSSVAVDVGAGFLGGGQVGCDYQFASNWVIGLAGDFSWANINGQATDPFFTGKNGNPITLNSKTDQLATATARLGYAWDHFLLYGKGGAAWAHDKYSIQNLISFGPPFCFSGTFIACNPAGSETRTGWTAGAGIEWAFTNNWSALVEFDYYGLGNKGVSFFDPNAGVGGTSGLVNVKQNIEALKFGINYRFGWAGPVTARY
jgi:outer membrane immunogenic protein